MSWPRAVSLVNGRVVTAAGTADSVRFARRIAAIGERPRAGDAVVDVQGAFVLPGLVNAHDHLELNHYGRLKFADRYDNAIDWIDDMRPRLSSDPGIRAGRSHPLADRLFIGALKNLLAGVTLVAHHNPFYRDFRCGLPIRVVRRYGWAHSFALEGQPAGARGEPGGDVGTRWRSTPARLPFFVHLAEGVDARAAAELPKLEALGCLAANTVLVHGVAIAADGWRRIAASGGAVVWCPASNGFLFGRTIDVEASRAAGARVAIGTDSRITGSRDLLDELRSARAAAATSADDLLAMVTTRAADIVRQPPAGQIAVGLPADLTVVPALADNAAEALLAAERRDIALVTIGGRPLFGSRGIADRVFAARSVSAKALCVDGARKLASAALVRRIAGCSIAEPGVTV